MAPHLIRMNGDVQGKAYPITKPALVIGRADNADIVLESRFASRHHAELHYAEGIYTLYVPEGKQVLVNGQQISGQVRISPGDTIDFPDERFSFGEVKVEIGKKKEAAKIDPVRLVVIAVIVLFVGGYAYMSLNAPSLADAPDESAQIDYEKLKVLISGHPELKDLERDIFFRGDYISAMNRLNTQVGSSVTPEQRIEIKEVILGLVMQRVANQFASGMDNFRTQQMEAARTNFNTVVRLETLFDTESKKVALPAHPRLRDDRGGYLEITVEDALAASKHNILRCDAILQGRADPGPPGAEQAEAG